MRFVFCPMCVAKLEMSISQFEHVERLSCPKCGFIDYNNSRPTVSALILNDKNEVLLVRRAWHPFQGYLDVPGGFLESGEHPHHGLIREIKEELNADISFDKIPFTMECDVYDDLLKDVNFASKGCPTLNIFFLTKLVGSSPRVNDRELAGMEWIDMKTVIEILDKVAFKSNQVALIKLHNHLFGVKNV